MRSWLPVLIFIFSVLSVSAQDPGSKRNASIFFAGLERTFIVHFPDDFISGKAYPLVLGLHGGGGTGAQFERSYGFSEMAACNGFIAVYPDGTKGPGRLGLRTWNAGGCCAASVSGNIDDAGFLAALIDTMIARYGIDSSRVYVTGMSNGAMMAYRLAADFPLKITAIAPVAGSMDYPEAAKPPKTIPVLHIHSGKDERVPWKGGKGIGGFQFPPLEEGLNTWGKWNNAVEKKVEAEEGYAITSWLNKEGEPVVKLYFTEDGGHSWPGSKITRRVADPPSIFINANELIIQFFKEQPAR